MLKASKASLKNKTKLTSTVVEFEFEMVDPLRLVFKAGQYIAIDIAPKVKRQYSIASSPSNSKKSFKIVIDVKPNGIGTKYLMGLNIGDVINFIGGIGLFILPARFARDVFFIGTGTGLAPLKSMVEEILAQNAQGILSTLPNIHLYFGTRYKEDIFYEDSFNKYLQESKIKDYKIFLSREQNSKKHQTGYVSKFIDFHDVEVLHGAQYFLCGSGEMIKSVEGLLIDKNINQASIYYEKFY